MTSRIREWTSKRLVTLGSVFAFLVLAALVLIPPILAQEQAAGTDTAGAQKQTCLNNEKRLILGLLQYQQDYDEKLPCGTQPTPGGALSGVGWAGVIYSYLRDSRPFHCPTDPTISVRPQFAISYGFNNNASNQAQVSFDNPARTLLLFEAGGDPVYLHSPDEGASQGATTFSASGDGTDGTLRAGPQAAIIPDVHYACGYLGGRKPNNPPGQFSQHYGRHADAPIFSYADGHVVSLDPSLVSAGADAPDPFAPQAGGATGTAAGAETDIHATFSVR